MNEKYNRAQFEQYAESQGLRDFEYDQDDTSRYRNPFTQREWNYWVAALECVAQAARATPAQPVPEGSALYIAREALQFYADQCHFILHDPSAWDTVSGEPVNFYEDENNTATVEDGWVAKQALEQIAGAKHTTPSLFINNPAQPAPSPSSVGAAIRALPLPELIYSFSPEQVRALLSEAAALAEQVQGQQWISVEDRLPPNGKDVVVWCGYCVTAQRTSDKHDPENHNGWVIDFDNGRASAITHWLELPAAPSIAQDGQKSEGA